MYMTKNYILLVLSSLGHFNLNLLSICLTAHTCSSGRPNSHCTNACSNTGQTVFQACSQLVIYISWRRGLREEWSKPETITQQRSLGLRHQFSPPIILTWVVSPERSTLHHQTTVVILTFHVTHTAPSHFAPGDHNIPAVGCGHFLLFYHNNSPVRYSVTLEKNIISSKSLLDERWIWTAPTKAAFVASTKHQHVLLCKC